MSEQPAVLNAPAWRTALPTLSGRTVVTARARPAGPRRARRPVVDWRRHPLRPRRAGVNVAVQELIERFARERASGLAVTYAIVATAPRTIVGLAQVRQLDPAFEAAEWECTIAPSSRGSGLFLDAARLIGSFAFGRSAPTVSRPACSPRTDAETARCGSSAPCRRACCDDRPPRRRVCRSGALVAAEGRLGRPLGVDGPRVH